MIPHPVFNAHLFFYTQKQRREALFLCPAVKKAARWAAFRPSKNLFFDGKGYRPSGLTKNAFGKMNSPKALKFQPFHSANTGNPRPGVVVKCAPLCFPRCGKLRYADLLLLFQMKPTALGFHSGKRGKGFSRKRTWDWSSLTG